jgi:hypothetical protein
MKLYKFGLFLAVTLMFTVFVIGQDDLNDTDANNNQNPKETRKVNEIGKATECDLNNSLQNVRDGELGADPTAKLYIIIYDEKDRLPSEYDSKRLEQNIRKQFTFLGLDENRTVIINGGFRDKLIAEVWIVPEGGNLPEPTNTVPKSEAPKNKTYLYDRSFFYNVPNYEDLILDSVKEKQAEENRLDEEESARDNPEFVDENLPEEITPEETAESPMEDEESYIEEFEWIKADFAEIIKNKKQSHGVLIFYADNQYYDVEKLQSEIEKAKQRVVAESGIKAALIQIIFGGYREEITIEFWVVPNKGKRPIPTPTERPAEILPEPKKSAQ